MSPATAQFPTLTALFRSAENQEPFPITVPCEPISDHLAITPALGMHNGLPSLDGGFLITHRSTGLRLPGYSCLWCCRSVGAEIASLDIDWDTGDTDPLSFDGRGNTVFLDRLPTATRDALVAAIRQLNRCSAVDCSFGFGEVSA